MSLFEESRSYKPFKYQWAFDAFLEQNKMHWMPEEVPLREDVVDWTDKLTDRERSLLTNIFRFFTQADIDVHDCYMQKYSQLFKPNEIRMMLSSFQAMEAIHVHAYSLVLQTVGLPDSAYSEFLEYPEMVEKHDFMNSFSFDKESDALPLLAAYGAFTEGLQLFASFAILLNLPRFGLMCNMGQIIAYSVRDEDLHCTSIIKLFHELVAELGDKVDKAALERDVTKILREVIRMEDNFIDLVFKDGELRGLTSGEVKEYIRFIGDLRLTQLGMPKLYNIDKMPLPWLSQQLKGVEFGNFFETTVTEYSKGSLEGDWGEAY